MNKAVKEGVFFLEGEGKVPGEAIARHYIPHLNNVVFHAEDGEFIVLFDPNRKKLLLIDKFYVKQYLGSAPIYVMQIPTVLSPQIFTAGENLSVDFIKHLQDGPPFDSIAPDIEQNMDIGLVIKNLFFLLAISLSLYKC